MCDARNICNKTGSQLLLRHGACLPLPDRRALFLDGVLGVCDGDGKRGRVGGPAGLAALEVRTPTPSTPAPRPSGGFIGMG